MDVNIDEKLSALRRARGLSQEQLADALQVSRQAVGKWESGRAAPELNKLVELCDFYGVSLDALVRASECAVKCVRADAPERGAIIPFLIRAKRATYAGHGAEEAPSRPASHDLKYREGALSYYDTYLGGEKFAGEEAVWDGDTPVWAMNYAGRVLATGFGGDFLKEALAAVPEDMPYRGPRLFQRGAYSYHCVADGDFGWFTGFEEAFSEGEKVYECRFHGGLII
jgi:transcriptional regulator with XRE-family HTH domain